MAIKYITTATKGDAHQSDILGLATSKKFTITGSSDGFVKVWDNSSFERAMVTELKVDPLGVHHVTIFEDTLVGSGLKVLFIGCVGFSGQFYLLSYQEGELAKCEFSPNLITKPSSYWAPLFVKDEESGQDHYLCITTVTGPTQVFNLNFEEDQTIPTFTHKGELTSNDSSFATCINSHIGSKKIVTGHHNGSVYLFDLQRLVLVFNFETYGLKQGKGNSINIVRSLAFSPNGENLAIARDSGPYGTVSIHDVKYGEFLGSLTVATHSSNVGVGSYAHKKWCMSVDFNADGSLIATGGFDNKVRIWDIESRQCEATLTLNTTDIADEELENSTSLDQSSCVALKFIAPGVISEDGKNDSLVVVGLDRAIRWFREAGGV